MSRGFLVLAQDENTSEDKKLSYISQACLLAKTLKKHNAEEKISVVTNNKIQTKDLKYFDKVISIPGNDDATSTQWKIENRHKLYQCTPYDNTIVMDVDMVVLEDISRWWTYLEKYDLFFTSNVKTYRQELVTEDSYRKVFTANNLPNIYTGLHYFKKSKTAEEFYNMLELICNNWKVFFAECLPKNTPPVLSIDVAASLAIKILGIESQVLTPKSSVTFTHMKSLIQNWKTYSGSWQDNVSPYIGRNGDLKIGNSLQKGVLHYTEETFLDCPGIENLHE